MEIDQEIPVSLSGVYTLPTDFQMVVRLQEAIDIGAFVPVRTMLPLDIVLESSVLKIGQVKIPIKGEIPVSMDIPVKTKALIHSESFQVRLTEPLKLDLPQHTVPLKAKIRVNIPLRLPEPSEEEKRLLPPGQRHHKSSDGVSLFRTARQRKDRAKDWRTGRLRRSDGAGPDRPRHHQQCRLLR